MKTYKELLERNSILLESLNEPFKNFAYQEIVYINEGVKEESNNNLNQSNTQRKVDFKGTRKENLNKKEIYLDEVIHNQTERFVKERMSKCYII
jgi:hypothetical protein